MAMVDVSTVLNQLEIGDIVVGKYSYNMTFYNFYEVKGKTKCSVKLQKLGKRSVGGTLYSMPVVPAFNCYTGKVITRRVNKYGCCMEDGEYSTTIYLQNKYDSSKQYCEDHMD